MGIGRIASSALGLCAFIAMATVGVLWVAAFIGIEPFATWLRTAGGALMLFAVVSALVLVAGSALYGLYYPLRHIRDWPRAGRLTWAFLKGKTDEAGLVRAVLSVTAIALLFNGMRTYYGCHFADRCWSMAMMARSDGNAVEFAGAGIAVGMFAVWLRGVRP